MKSASAKRRVLSVLDLNSAAGHPPDKSRLDYSDSESSLEFLEKSEQNEDHRLIELRGEVERLEEELSNAHDTRRIEAKLTAKLKQDLIGSERRLAEAERLNRRQAKEVSAKLGVIERLEQHINRLEEQISERDAKHETTVRTEATYLCTISLHKALLKECEKRAETTSISLQEANLHIKSLEQEISFLWETIALLKAEPKCLHAQTADCQEARPDYDELSQINEGSMSHHLDVLTSLRTSLDDKFASDEELLEVLGGKKGSFIDVTDFRQSLRFTMQDNSLGTFEHYEVSCEAELRAKVVSLESAVAYWTRESTVRQEYIDEQAQLIAYYRSRPAA
jgi:chromosome segregation ATPase